MFTSWCPSESVQRPNAELLRGVFNKSAAGPKAPDKHSGQLTGQPEVSTRRIVTSGLSTNREISQMTVQIEKLSAAPSLERAFSIGSGHVVRLLCDREEKLHIRVREQNPE